MCPQWEHLCENHLVPFTKLRFPTLSAGKSRSPLQVFQGIGSRLISQGKYWQILPLKGIVVISVPCMDSRMELFKFQLSLSNRLFDSFDFFILFLQLLVIIVQQRFFSSNSVVLRLTFVSNSRLTRFPSGQYFPCDWGQRASQGFGPESPSVIRIRSPSAKDNRTIRSEMQSAGCNK